MKRPVWAIVPAKSLKQGKSRLRAVFDDAGRALFARSLLEHVLDVLGTCVIDGVLVATGGDDVADVARERGAHVLRDLGAGSLADVVDRALDDVASRGAIAAVVLMADLPRIEASDVRGLLAMLEEHDVALVPDHLGHHTNALALAPPGAMRTSFGRDDSFARHEQGARALGLRVVTVDNARIAFDVDLPVDHEMLTGRWAAGRR